MGGYGSTRWAWHTKKVTVEDCTAMSIFRLARDGVIRPDGSSGRLWWEDGRGQTSSSVSFTIRPVKGRLLLTLSYQFTAGPNKGRDVEEWVWLQSTRPTFGGLRWWYTCPLIVNGRACGRRVAKLYLPPGAVYFGCRHCHDLSYQTAQEAHKYDRSSLELIRKLGELDKLARRYDRLFRRT